MFSREKIRIRINIFLRRLIYHSLFWSASLLFYFFLTGNSGLFSSYFNLLKIGSVYVIVFILAIAISIIFSFLDSVLTDRLMRYSPIKALMLFRSLIYFVLAFSILLVASNKSFDFLYSVSYQDFFSRIPEMDIDFIRFMVFFFICSVLNHSFKEMVKRIGLGNFRNWFFGLLNKPIEEERIFMFIDMTSSTSIAEKLKHKKFSHLVQDIFNDMAVVDNYYGQIYQYLGDGAIISWSLKKGLKKNNCLKAYFAYTNIIERRSRYFQRNYGLVPKFKAGLHVGKIMVLQVGRIRRDISYNGDTLNTTARIESMCNEYKQDLLISGDLYNMLEDSSEFNLKTVGNIKLKGKKVSTEIYQVKPKKKEKPYGFIFKFNK